MRFADSADRGGRRRSAVTDGGRTLASMADHVTFDEAGVVPEDSARPSLPWEVPEIAAVGILVAFSLIVVGGVATGIDVSTGRQQPFFDQLENVWNAIEFGTSWAGPVLAIVLLAVVGLCWWQVEAWSVESPPTPLEPSSAHDYIRRAQKISLWALGSLVITVVGAVAGCVALVASNIPAHPGRVGWSRVFGVGAGLAAVIVVAAAGLLVVIRLMSPAVEGVTQRPGSADPESSFR